MTNKRRHCIMLLFFGFNKHGMLLMHIKKISTIFYGFLLASASSSAIAELLKEPSTQNELNVYGELLYLQPTSGNLKYAVLVSGAPPYQQSWHNQTLNPTFSPAFQVGLNYYFSEKNVQASIDWLELRTNDSSFKQGSHNPSFYTLEFVAPPFEVGPPSYGIKRADSNVTFSFDKIDLNFGKIFEYNSNLRAHLFGGVDIVRINQTLTTVFSDYAGALPTPYSYGLPPDPNYSFKLKNTSTYIGAGPDVGLNVEYNVYKGIGCIGQLMGALTAGSISVADDFTSTSTRLDQQGYSPSHQEITAPNATQIVPGFDGKLGIFYDYTGQQIAKLRIEAGYRVGSFNNAISEVKPSTLVQAGTNFETPNFATGTMAIDSTTSQNMNFGYNGPYVDFKVAFN